MLLTFVLDFVYSSTLSAAVAKIMNSGFWLELAT
jgi:hypothetical protein